MVTLVVQATALGAASLIFASLTTMGPVAVRGGSDPGTRRSWLRLAGGLVAGPGTVAVLAAVWSAPGGLPGLVGTRHGRLLLLQSALLMIALGLLATLRSERPDLRWRLAAETLVGLGMTSVALILIALPSAHEPIVWPFRFRLAPGVTWRIRSLQDEIISGVGIGVAGVLIALLAVRSRTWRPLLLAASLALGGLGTYKALSAMALDAYPTTYARPAVAATAKSVGRGRDLFAAHCAMCHGPAGRGDGPAAAGLLQLPADLASAHTADHTLGDIFWWVTHGLGLAMPAFGDRLTPEQRWDLVNFVRTLSAPPPETAGQGR